MAKIMITIAEYEKVNILNAIRLLGAGATSVDKIAKKAELPTNRIRFVVEDLIAEGRIERVVIRDINPKYKRYRYIITVGGKK